MQIEIIHSLEFVKSAVIHALAFDHRQQLLAVAQNNSKGKNPTLFIFDIVQNNKTIIEKTENEYFNSVLQVAWHEDYLIYLIETGPGIFLCKTFHTTTKTYSQLHQFVNTSHIAIQVDGDELFIADQNIQVYDLKNLKKVQTLEFPAGYHFCYRVNTDWYWMATDQQTLALLDIKTGKIIYQKEQLFNQVQGSTKYTLVTGENFNGIFCWKTPDGETVDLAPFNNPDQTFYSSAIHPQTNIVALGSRIGHLHLIQLPSGQMLYRERVLHHPVYTICWSRDGKFLAAGGGKGDVLVLKITP